jgi:hypothetical protein
VNEAGDNQDEKQQHHAAAPVGDASQVQQPQEQEKQQQADGAPPASPKKQPQPPRPAAPTLSAEALAAAAAKLGQEPAARKALEALVLLRDAAAVKAELSLPTAAGAAAAGPGGAAAGAGRLPTCGLVNTGNTCFLNSILQALMASAKWREFLEVLSLGWPSLCPEVYPVLAALGRFGSDFTAIQPAGRQQPGGGAGAGVPGSSQMDAFRAESPPKGGRGKAKGPTPAAAAAAAAAAVASPSKATRAMLLGSKPLNPSMLDLLVALFSPQRAAAQKAAAAGRGKASYASASRVKHQVCILGGCGSVGQWRSWHIAPRPAHAHLLPAHAHLAAPQQQEQQEDAQEFLHFLLDKVHEESRALRGMLLSQQQGNDDSGGGAAAASAEAAAAEEDDGGEWAQVCEGAWRWWCGDARGWWRAGCAPRAFLPPPTTIHSAAASCNQSRSQVIGKNNKAATTRGTKQLSADASRVGQLFGGALASSVKVRCCCCCWCEPCFAAASGFTHAAAGTLGLNLRVINPLFLSGCSLLLPSPGAGPGSPLHHDAAHHSVPPRPQRGQH